MHYHDHVYYEVKACKFSEHKDEYHMFLSENTLLDKFELFDRNDVATVLDNLSEAQHTPPPKQQHSVQLVMAPTPASPYGYPAAASLIQPSSYQTLQVAPSQPYSVPPYHHPSVVQALPQTQPSQYQTVPVSPHHSIVVPIASLPQQQPQWGYPPPGYPTALAAPPQYMTLQTVTPSS